MDRSKRLTYDYFRCVVIVNIRLLQSQMLGILDFHFFVCAHRDARAWNCVHVALDTSKTWISLLV